MLFKRIVNYLRFESTELDPKQVISFKIECKDTTNF